MTPELAYFLKVNIAIAVFYAFYRLFFYKDTFFQWRRTAMIAFLAISLAYPMLNIQEWIKEQESMAVMADLYSAFLLPDIPTAEAPEIQTGWWSQSLTFFTGFLYLYAGVFLLLFARFFIQLVSIIRLAFNTRTVRIQRIKVHVPDEPYPPFSFFRWIFINPDSHSGEQLNEILTHELAHVRQWHSADVIFCEILCICCWFNPFIWLMRREIRNNLEFMADHKVLESGHDCKKYQYHLLALANQKSVATLYNSFNVLSLKNRIKMMNKRRTGKIGKTKYLIFLPLAALLLLISNIEAIARSTDKLMDEKTTFDSSFTDNQILQQEKEYLYKGIVTDNNNKPLSGAAIVIDESNTPHPKTNAKGEFSFKSGEKVNFTVIYETGNNKGLIQSVSKQSDSPDRENMVIKLSQTGTIHKVSDEEVFELPEVMPEFPGGVSELMNFMKDHLKYPEEAVKNNKQGRVIVQFVVDKEGNAINPVIKRSVDPSLDNEALRLISEMPKWIPGKQKGKPVSVKYTIPVNFNIPQKTDAQKANP